MTRDEAVVRIQRILGFRTDKVTEIIDALKDTQVELEGGHTLPWFLKTEIATQTTTIDEERVALPDGSSAPEFIREVEADALWLFDAAATDPEDEWTPLVKDMPEFNRRNLPGSGEPKGYSLTRKYFRIFPTPDKVYTLKMVYYGKDSVLTSNVENQWLKHAHDLMIGEAGLKMGPLLFPEAVREFTRLATQGRDRMIRETEAREAANFRYVMGGVD